MIKMKKIGKLSINPEKVIKNVELVNLTGGYKGGSPCCTCHSVYFPYNMVGSGIIGSTPSECASDCKAIYGDWVDGWLETAY